MTVLNTSTGRALFSKTKISGPLAFSPDNRQLALVAHEDKKFTLKFWNASDGTLQLTFPSSEEELRSIAFSPDGRTLATGSFSSGTITLWSAETGTIRHQLTGGTGTVHAISFSRDGRTLASCDEDPTIKLWDVSNGRLIQSFFAGDKVRSLAFSPDGASLASSGDNVTLWDVSKAVAAR
jgi:WD40 repeat protein